MSPSLPWLFPPSQVAPVRLVRDSDEKVFASFFKKKPLFSEPMARD
jgi:hypothetical protein